MLNGHPTSNVLLDPAVHHLFDLISSCPLSCSLHSSHPGLLAVPWMFLVWFLLLFSSLPGTVFPQIVTLLLLPLPWGLYPKVYPVTNMTISCSVKNDPQFHWHSAPHGSLQAGWGDSSRWAGRFCFHLWIFFLASQLGPRLRSSSLLLRNSLLAIAKAEADKCLHVSISSFCLCHVC